MEFPDNGNISDKINYLTKNKMHLEENIIWDILTQILIGLNYLHNKGIIHRNLKSKNIFLTKHRLVKISDFNSCYIFDNIIMDINQKDDSFYIAPELWNEQLYNNYKCDIWSLGCIIYEMASLSLPFNGENKDMLFTNIKNGKYKPIPDFYSKNLKSVINDMLIFDISKRPSTDILLNYPNIKETREKLTSIYNKYNNYINLKKLDNNIKSKIIKNIKEKMNKKLNIKKERKRIYKNISNSPTKSEYLIPEEKLYRYMNKNNLKNEVKEIHNSIYLTLNQREIIKSRSKDKNDSQRKKNISNNNYMNQNINLINNNNTVNRKKDNIIISNNNSNNYLNISEFSSLPIYNNNNSSQAFKIKNNLGGIKPKYNIIKKNNIENIINNNENNIINRIKNNISKKLKTFQKVNNSAKNKLVILNKNDKINRTINEKNSNSNIIKYKKINLIFKNKNEKQLNYIKKHNLSLINTNNLTIENKRQNLSYLHGLNNRTEISINENIEKPINKSKFILRKIETNFISNLPCINSFNYSNTITNNNQKYETEIDHKIRNNSINSNSEIDKRILYDKRNKNNQDQDKIISNENRINNQLLLYNNLNKGNFFLKNNSFKRKITNTTNNFSKKLDYNLNKKKIKNINIPINLNNKKRVNNMTISNRINSEKITPNNKNSNPNIININKNNYKKGNINIRNSGIINDQYIFLNIWENDYKITD